MLENAIKVFHLQHADLHRVLATTVAAITQVCCSFCDSLYMLFNLRNYYVATSMVMMCMEEKRAKFVFHTRLHRPAVIHVVKMHAVLDNCTKSMLALISHLPKKSPLFGERNLHCFKKIKICLPRPL